MNIIKILVNISSWDGKSRNKQSPVVTHFPNPKLILAKFNLHKSFMIFLFSQDAEGSMKWGKTFLQSPTFCIRVFSVLPSNYLPFLHIFYGKLPQFRNSTFKQLPVILGFRGRNRFPGANWR